MSIQNLHEEEGFNQEMTPDPSIVDMVSFDLPKEDLTFYTFLGFELTSYEICMRNSQTQEIQEEWRKKYVGTLMSINLFIRERIAKVDIREGWMDRLVANPIVNPFTGKMTLVFAKDTFSGVSQEERRVLQ